MCLKQGEAAGRCSCGCGFKRRGIWCLHSCGAKVSTNFSSSRTSSLFVPPCLHPCILTVLPTPSFQLMLTYIRFPLSLSSLFPSPLIPVSHTLPRLQVSLCPGEGSDPQTKKEVTERISGQRTRKQCCMKLFHVFFQGMSPCIHVKHYNALRQTRFRFGKWKECVHIA